MPEQITAFLNNCWTVLGQMSPYLLFGFLISGVLSVFISPRWIEKHLGGGKFSSIIKATLFGIPLPLCSCGVIPVAASLRKHGASKSATTSFLLSTPQTGVDSILATWGLLGGVFAIFRPLAALITGIFGGLLVSLADEDLSESHPETDQTDTNDSPELTTAGKIKAALWYGLVTLPGEIARPLFFGILVAGLISTFVTGGILNQYLTSYYLTLFLMLLVGIPLYVCSTSSIPIALSFIHLGVTPGAALVFLISGPATNAAAISVVWKVLGKKSAIIYLLTVILGSLLGGIAFDALDQNLTLNAIEHVHHSGGEAGNLLENVSAIFLLLTLAYSYYYASFAGACCSSCASPGAARNDNDGKVIHLTVEGMSCGNCANAVKRVLSECPGVTQTEVNLKEKSATVHCNLDNASELIKAVDELGYQASLKK